MKDTYTLITDRIISELESGTIPWHKPWTCAQPAISHTTGKAGMTQLDMAVWLADTIEPTRAPYPLLDKTRMLAGLSLEKAMITSLEGTLQHVRKKGDAVHPATLETLDYLKNLPQ